MAAPGRKQPIALLLNDLPLRSAKQPFKKQLIKVYELLLTANSGSLIVLLPLLADSGDVHVSDLRLRPISSF
jgi:hypothetical protein